MYDKARSIQEFLALLDHLEIEQGSKKLKIFLSSGEGLQLTVEIERVEPKLSLVSEDD